MVCLNSQPGNEGDRQIEPSPLLRLKKFPHFPFDADFTCVHICVNVYMPQLILYMFLCMLIKVFQHRRK